ncbi:hypothetical protein PYJP_10920 [Pyrofollis japonicus]|uniref:phosphatase PAP2 family protein n=1 Tax=Pyrofollis japonicus TaxID=3060460 RepID=UPI00295BF3F2|nr:phosphatase PAP2 family protein [Pyrofollis japonicus]BEP17740.1 hypothetical protein PYJP_10920 [Pyrofollis japonicus]
MISGEIARSSGAQSSRVHQVIIRYTLYFLPFLVAYMLYESIRAIVVSVRGLVYYGFLLEMSKKLFGTPLTLVLASHRNIVLDIVAGVVYALHPIYFFLFAVYALLKSKRVFEYLLAAFIVSSAVAITVYVVMPSAPPWIALPGVQRPPNFLLEILEKLTGARIDPNPYAAMPSMHLAMATIFAYYYYRLRHRLVLPITWVTLMAFSTMYTLNHYFVDVVAGIALGLVSCIIADRYLGPRLGNSLERIVAKLVAD